MTGHPNTLSSLCHCVPITRILSLSTVSRLSSHRFSPGPHQRHFEPTPPAVQPPQPHPLFLPLLSPFHRVLSPPRHQLLCRPQPLETSEENASPRKQPLPMTHTAMMPVPTSLPTLPFESLQNSRARARARARKHTWCVILATSPLGESINSLLFRSNAGLDSLVREPVFLHDAQGVALQVCVASRNVTLCRLHAHNHSLAHALAHLQNGERVLKLQCTEVSTAGTTNMPNFNSIQEHLPNEPP